MMLSKRETVYLIICYKDREFTHDICSIFGMICGLHVLPLEYIHFYILSKRSNHCVELFAAEYFTDRTDVQCLHRWQKVLNPDLVKGPWTKEVALKSVLHNCTIGLCSVLIFVGNHVQLCSPGG